MSSYLAHELRGEVDPELQEIEDGRQILTSLMLATIKEVAMLRKQQQPILKRWLGGTPLAVMSLPAYYREGQLEPDQQVTAVLDSPNHEISAGLYVGLVSGEQHTQVKEPTLKVSADQNDGLAFAVNDRVLRPCDQLELVTSSIATVELIRLETQLALK
jgi:hypothetical protein